jgi:hypothetical protein
MRIEAEPISSLIEYLTLLLASTGSPAEFFSLMSVKTVSNVSANSYLYFEDRDTCLLEDGNNILAEVGYTKLTTSEPHYFHEGDEIWLDEFEGTNLEGINGSPFKVSDVESEGNILLEGYIVGSILQEDTIPLGNSSYDGTYSTYGYLRNELGYTFTLSDPKTTYASHIEEAKYDDFDISTATITTNGKIFRTGKEMTTGIPISLLAKEYVGEYYDQVIHNYEHFCPSDFSTLTDGINWETRARHLSIESMILLDSTNGSADAGDEILQEDGVPTTSGTYSGTASALGKILANEGLVDIGQHEGEISITEPQHRTVTATYIIDHDFNSLVLEDDTGGKISTEDSIIQNQVISFDRPFDYKGQPYENNYGFLYYNHKIDQRVSV